MTRFCWAMRKRIVGEAALQYYVEPSQAQC